jgi:hypothetical protein
VICIAVTLFKAGNKRFAIAFFLSVLGLIYIMEHIMVVYLNAYQYHPGVYGDQALEDTLGNVTSQISISATALLMIVFDLSFVWNVIFAAVYFLIEIFFIHLGIYEHNWYRSWFTPVILVPLFWFFKKWYRLASGSRSCLLHHVDLFLSCGTALYHLVSIPFLLLGIQWMRIGLLPDATDDHRAVTLIYGILLVIFTMLLHKWKAHWVWKSLCFGLLFAYHYALYLLNIFNVRNGWFIPAALVYILVCYGLVQLLDIWHKSGNPYWSEC